MMVGKQAGVEEALEGSSQWSEPRCLGLKTQVGGVLPLQVPECMEQPWSAAARSSGGGYGHITWPG